MNPYDPPTTACRHLQRPGRVWLYLTNRRTSFVTGVLYTAFCVGSIVGLPVASLVTIFLGVATLPFILGIVLVEVVGFNGPFSTVAAGCTAAFMFAASMHLLAGRFLRQRSSNGAAMLSSNPVNHW